MQGWWYNSNAGGGRVEGVCWICLCVRVCSAYGWEVRRQLAASLEGVETTHQKAVVLVAHMPTLDTL